MGDVADYIGISRAGVQALWPGVVRAWDGYLRTGRHGRDPITDILVMDALVLAGFEGRDLPVPG